MTVRWHLKHEQHGSKPWPVQAEALRRAEGRPRYGHYLEQGLGKTALDLNEFIDFEDVDLNVVLAPSSFVGDWPLAPAEWGLGFLRTGLWGYDEMPHDWESGLYAISHETLRGSKQARDELASLMQNRRCLLTFDETTGIKNPTSDLARYTLTELSRHAKRVRELNGTPLVQNVMDYYAPLRLLGELHGTTRVGFRNRFAQKGGYMGRQIVGMRNEEELARIIDGCSFRALKKDWRPGMPDQVDTPVHLEMTATQQRHYRTMMEEFYVMVEDGAIDVDLILTQRIKLQQISSCMVMDQGKHHWLEQPGNNPKLKAALDLMATGHGKMIVVYFFDPSGRMLIDQFQKASLNPAWITGGMKPAEIVEQKRRFNDDSSCRAIIGQIDQTSRGHTLLGRKGNDRCHRIYMYETSLSLMHVLQVRDRNHRGEQDETCDIYWPICSPIDQLNVDILTKKKTQAEGMDALVKAVRSWKARGGRF